MMLADTEITASVMLLDADGHSHVMESLWQSKRILLVFLRHFGCRFCRKDLFRLMAVQPILSASNVTITCIGIGTPAQAKQFLKETKFDGELYVDLNSNEPESYRRCLLNRDEELLKNANTIDAAKLAAAEGYIDGGYPHPDGTSPWTGDVFQLGGFFVMGPGSSCTYAYRCKFAGDFPSMKEMMAAATVLVDVDLPNTEQWLTRIRADSKAEIPDVATVVAQIGDEQGRMLAGSGVARPRVNTNPQPSADIPSSSPSATVIATSSAPSSSLSTTTATPTTTKTTDASSNGFNYYLILAVLIPIIANFLKSPSLVGLSLLVPSCALLGLLIHRQRSTTALEVASQPVTAITAPEPVAAPTSASTASEVNIPKRLGSLPPLYTPKQIDDMPIRVGTSHCDCSSIVMNLPFSGLSEPEHSVHTTDVDVDDSEVYHVTNCYVREFLAKPHSMLGRSGPTCPFVPAALKMDTLYISVIRTGLCTIDEMRAKVRDAAKGFAKEFRALEPTDSKRAMYRAVILVFPDVPLECSFAVIDATQLDLKPEFTAEGLMIGEFHLYNNCPGLHNPDFYPLRTPYPSIAMRNMVPSDVVFMKPESYSKALRETFLRNFIHKFEKDGAADKQLQVAVECLNRIREES